jgi:transposase-like protein
LADKQQVAVPAPTVCAFCGSSKITTSGMHTDSAAYWRCETCGEVWNVVRLRPVSRWDQERRWK